MIEPAEVARALEDEGLTGWLLYDFDGLDPLAQRAAGLEGRLLTRRWFCLLRRDGPPRWLVHAIERAVFADRPGEVHTYAGRRELEAGLRSLLAGHERVAMSYSPQANVPTVSRLDAGTFELVSRAGGVEIVSAGDLVQRLLAPWP
ncbi:MAG: aminopeptidase P family protein, partial [Planctomycetota bacterium]